MSAPARLADGMRRLVLCSVMCSASGLMACDGADTNDAAPEPAEAAEDATAPADGTDKDDPSPPEVVGPPEVPDGTVYDAASGLLIQSCAERHPCSAQLHGAGKASCEALELDDYDAWRLPTRTEIEGFAHVDGLAALEGYHWSGSPDEGNASMFWIADPKGTQPTTLPPDRKPFLIRCVHAVGG